MAEHLGIDPEPVHEPGDSTPMPGEIRTGRVCRICGQAKLDEHFPKTCNTYKNVCADCLPAERERRRESLSRSVGSSESYREMKKRGGKRTCAHCGQSKFADQFNGQGRAATICDDCKADPDGKYQRMKRYEESRSQEQTAGQAEAPAPLELPVRIAKGLDGTRHNGRAKSRGDLAVFLLTSALGYMESDNLPMATAAAGFALTVMETL